MAGRCPEAEVGSYRLHPAERCLLISQDIPHLFVWVCVCVQCVHVCAKALLAERCRFLAPGMMVRWLARLEQAMSQYGNNGATFR